MSIQDAGVTLVNRGEVVAGGEEGNGDGSGLSQSCEDLGKAPPDIECKPNRTYLRVKVSSTSDLAGTY